MVEDPVMNTAKEAILQRIRAALGDDQSVWGEKKKSTRMDTRNLKTERGYRTHGDMNKQQRVRLFVRHVEEYKARVSEISEQELPHTVSDICSAEKVKKLVIPPGLDGNWLPGPESGLTFLRDEPDQLSHDELDKSDAVLTGCFRAVAQTGTIVLNAGPGQGRRALTLLPDFHICVVRREQITGIVPEVFWELDPVIRDEGAPVTFISGPSATSDIELDRVEGVHGPRRLHVVIV